MLKLLFLSKNHCHACTYITVELIFYCAIVSNKNEKFVLFFA